MSHVFVTGDFHGGFDNRKLTSKNFPEARQLTKDDYLIIAGDFGVLWKDEPDRNEQHWIRWLTKEKKWTTLFIDGNHENFVRLNNLPTEEKFGGRVGVVNDSIYHLRRGEIYTIYDRTFFCFGGALSWDKSRRKEYVSWWPEEMPTVEDKDYAWDNLKKHNSQVDYIITHTVPENLIELLGFRKGGKFDSTGYFLNDIYNSTKFKQWYCAHMHVDKHFGNFHVLYQKVMQIF